MASSLFYLNVLFVFIFLFHRKKFGWITFIVNLSLYLAFLLPFTALAVYLKINILELCDYQFENMTKHPKIGYYEHKPWVSDSRNRALFIDRSSYQMKPMQSKTNRNNLIIFQTLLGVDFILRLTVPWLKAIFSSFLLPLVEYYFHHRYVNFISTPQRVICPISTSTGLAR